MQTTCIFVKFVKQKFLNTKELLSSTLYLLKNYYYLKVTLKDLLINVRIYTYF